MTNDKTHREQRVCKIRLKREMLETVLLTCKGIAKLGLRVTAFLITATVLHNGILPEPMGACRPD